MWTAVDFSLRETVMDSSCTIAETIAHHLTTLITPPDHSQPNQLRPQPITPAAGNKVKAFLIKRLKANRNSAKALWVEEGIGVGVSSWLTEALSALKRMIL